MLWSERFDCPRASLVVLHDLQRLTLSLESSPFDLKVENDVLLKRPAHSAAESREVFRFTLNAAGEV